MILLRIVCFMLQVIRTLCFTNSGQAKFLISNHHQHSSTSPRKRKFQCIPTFMIFDNLFGGGTKKNKTTMTDEEIRAKYGVQLPKYKSTVVKENSGAGYEIRQYQPMSVVTTTYEARPEGYELLGGFCNNGENSLGLKMPKTAPCVMKPCRTPNKTMFFILPHPHTPYDWEERMTVAEAIDKMTPPPDPIVDYLKCSVIDNLTVAVVKFSGYAVPDVVFRKRDELKAMLDRDGVKYNADTVDEELMLAQYNEVYSLPWNRDNEVWLPIKVQEVAT